MAFFSILIRRTCTFATPSSSQRLPTISIISFASIVPDSFSSINAIADGDDMDYDDDIDENYHDDENYQFGDDDDI